MDTLRKWFRHMRLAFEILRLSTVHLAIALIALIVLGFVPQVFEALVVVAEDRQAHAFVRLATIEATALLLATMLWYSARVMLYLTAPSAYNDVEPGRRLAVRYLPRIFGLLPLFALSIAFWRASNIPTGTATSAAMIDAATRRAALKAPTFLRIGAGITVALTIAWFVALVSRRRMMRSAATIPHPGATGWRRTITPRLFGLEPDTSTAFGAMIFMWVLFFALTWWSGGLYAIAFGTVPTFLVCLATWAPMGTLVAYAGARWDLPVVRAVCGVVLLLAFTDCNDNHDVRKLDGGMPAARGFDKHLASWYRTRADVAQYGSDYPVFIVAAEGGGIRNAYLTASVLASLHDACPLFTHHLLAISGVSGGSVGAAVFTGLLHDLPAQPDLRCTMPIAREGGAMQAHVDSILSHDLLSPTIASGLYLEATQKFLPFGVGGFDRARGLEYAIERAYALDTAGGRKPSATMRSPFVSLTSDSLPLLFLNTTSVEEGVRMVIASAEPSSHDFHPRTLREISPTLNVRLSTAAFMSSRFPFVSPEAVVHDDSGAARRFVDGGYFDNSGATTAFDLAAAIIARDSLSPVAPGVHLRPVIIHVGLADSTRARETSKAGFSAVGLHEVLAPVRTMLSTRSARGTIVVSQLVEQSRLWKGGPQVIDLDAEQGQVPFVLGWLMSKNARQVMREKITPGLACPDTIPRPIRCAYDSIFVVLKVR